VGDLLLDAHRDRIIRAYLSGFAVLYTILVGFGVVFTQPDIAQTPVRRQILALNAMGGGEDVALTDQDTAARRRSAIGCNSV